MNQTLLGVIYLIAFSHAAMLAFVLWRRTQASEPGRVLSLVMMVVAYKLFEAGMLYTGLYHAVPHLLDLLPGEVLLIGPLIYFYALQCGGNQTQARLPRWLHFSPAMALWLYQLPGIFRNAEAKVAMWDGVLDSSGTVSLPWMIVGLLFLIKIHLASYLWASWCELKTLRQAAQQLRADATPIFTTQLAMLVMTFLGLEVLWVVLFCAQQFFAVGTLAMVSDIWLLLLSLVLLTLGYIALQHPHFVFTREERVLLQSQKQQSNQSDSNIKYFHSSLSETAANEIAKQIENCLGEHKLYLNDKLTLSDLAAVLELRSHILSQVINQQMHSNFYKLINGYRVQHAIGLIEDKKLSWSLERIALESGFSNRVTFSKAFKEITGGTASDYKKQVREAS
ncbi:helix-turn-helix domain-containing protein [Aliiglaciecola sp. CAU 1673]|uniref:helix-turn-helix domain-containing protein n=1 Tax=Aliiglaciecola sp. CAU 1673 TaxID=3032595 RepID=UPI0023DBC2B9|nr:helix-turn-helix domain-containing protein [Aliiglaciecola sp. CAU 1673]MDF2177949.1 helix-turn-helix domain-containing protein [Aliiglaciecola sp. CAU 1673]